MKDSRDIQEINEAFKQVDKTINSGHFDSANKILNKLYLKSKKIKYKEGENIYFEKKITLLLYTGEYYNSISIIQHLIEVYKETNEIKKLNHLNGKYGTILTKINDYKNGEYYLKKAIKFNLELEPINAKIIIAWQIQLANNYFSQSLIAKALDIINKSLEFAKDYNNLEEYKYFLEVTKLDYFIDLNKLNDAEVLYLKIENNIEFNGKLHNVSYNIVKIKFLHAVPKLRSNEFLKLVHSTLKTSFELSNKQYICELLNILKNYHFENNEKDLAYKYANQIIEINEKDSNKPFSIINRNKIKPIKPEKNETEYEIYYKSELDIAASYQLQFHSSQLEYSKLNIETIYAPSKTLSGDYIGTFKLDDGTFLTILADVVGKGITASYISFMLDGIIKSLIKSSGTFCLKNNIIDVNDIISDSLKNQGFVSLWVGIIDTNNKTLKSVNAGHLPAYIIKKEGDIIELNKGCTILGMFENLLKPDIEVFEFEEGDSLIAISDGITESLNKDGIYYNEKFEELLKKYAENKSFNLVNQLKKELKEFQDDTQIQDDVSCLFVDYKSN